MQPFREHDVSSQEWRWVALWAGFLVTLTMLPYAWAIVASSNDWQFLGILPNPQDGATYLSKIRQGTNGYWLFSLMHTPEEHDRAGLFLFYLFLGHVGRILGFSTVVTFHLARVATSLFMFTALYQLGAVIWKRLRPRRMFFLLTSIGSGLGWLVVILNPELLPPDLFIPEAFPLYAAYANPHFPLSIGVLALMVALFWQVFRPGYKEAPNVENGGLAVILYSVVLAIVQPPALMSFGGSLVILILIYAYMRRNIPWHELRWGSMIWLPALPFAIYYLLVFNFNDTMQEFNEQNITTSPHILLTIMGFGLLLLIAVPGIVRAVRQFERDGDQLMLIWLLINMMGLYFPFALQRRLFIGLIIPIVYFGVRAIEDFWLPNINARWHKIVIILVIVFLVPSNLLALGLPLFGAVADQEAGADAGILVNTNYGDVYEWLDDNSRQEEVVLASPLISSWIPAQSNTRVVYGHPFETVPNEEREDQVLGFFEGSDCETLLSDEIPFTVSYVIWGPEEVELGLEDEDDETSTRPGVAECRAAVESAATLQQPFGDVTLYVLREPR